MNSLSGRYLVAALLAATQAHAFTITGETAAANRRFTSWTPSTPGPLNTNPSFLGKDYDLTGYGWNPNNNVSTRPQMYSLVSPMHAAHAWHYSPAQGDWRILFVNAAGQQVMTNISERLNPSLPTSRTDVAILRLAAPVAPSYGLGIVRFLDFPGSASWSGLPAVTVGGEANGPGVALASIASITNSSVAIQASTSTTGWLNGSIRRDR